ncbi:MAG: hypothetical protein MK212_07185, partial [Saprospiraceae bacterium]|nr:hypothetical protein [Saprospiraceae bacterium]
MKYFLPILFFLVYLPFSSTQTIEPCSCYPNQNLNSVATWVDPTTLHRAQNTSVFPETLIQSLRIKEATWYLDTKASADTSINLDFNALSIFVALPQSVQYQFDSLTGHLATKISGNSTYTYSYDTKGKLTKMVSYHGNPVLNGKTEYYYNDKQRLYKTLVYPLVHPNSSMEIEPSCFINTYDEEGRLRMRDSRASYSKDISLDNYINQWKYMEVNNTKGQPKFAFEANIYSHDDHQIHTYTPNKKVSTYYAKSFSNKGIKKTREKVFAYDNTGNVIKEVTRNFRDGKLDYKFVYTFSY